MSNHNNSLYILNENINLSDLIQALTQKINSIHVLAIIATADDFTNFDERINKDYFWIIENFAGETKALIELLSNKHNDSKPIKKN